MKNDNVNIRHATNKDISALIDLRSLLLDSGSGIYVSSSVENSQKWKISYERWLKCFFKNNEKNKCILVALSDKNNVIGMSTGIVDERAPASGYLNGLTGWIQSVAVIPEYRNKKIGKKLIFTTLDWFNSIGVEKVFLQSTNEALNFYSNLGWMNTGESMLYKTLRG